jgi:phage-related holin
MKIKLMILMSQVAEWFDEMALLLLISLLSFLTPIKEWILLVGFLVVADMVSAIIATYKTKGLESIESRKLARTVAKFTAYGIVVMVTHAIETLFFPDIPAVKLVSGFVAMVEVKSIDENIKIITGKSFLKMVVELLSKQRKQAKDVINSKKDLQ